MKKPLKKSLAVVRVDWNRLGNMPGGLNHYDIEEAARDASLELTRLSKKRLAQVKTFAIPIALFENPPLEEESDSPTTAFSGNLFLAGLTAGDGSDEESLLARNWLAASAGRKPDEPEPVLAIFTRDPGSPASFTLATTLTSSELRSVETQQQQPMLTPVQVELARQFLFGAKKKKTATPQAKPAAKPQRRRDPVTAPRLSGSSDSA